MAPFSSMEFIDTALFSTTSFTISYDDPDRKWLIREHLISLLQDFPSLSPSMGTFVQNDGKQVELLNASGELHVSRTSPRIPITIWLHEFYPSMAPIVHLSPNPSLPFRQGHPFVDSAGVTTTPYLKMWSYDYSRRCNLSDMVHNLIKLFAKNHPFHHADKATSSSHHSLVSKLEAIDRLSCMLHYDMAELMDESAKEIEELLAIQAEVMKRRDITSKMVEEMEREMVELKRKEREISAKVEVLRKWQRTNGESTCNYGTSGVSDQIEDMYEIVGDDSKQMLEWVVGDLSLEDVMYALDKAVEEGVVSFDMYIKQVRALAREQFLYRFKLVELKGISDSLLVSLINRVRISV